MASVTSTESLDINPILAAARTAVEASIGKTEVAAARQEILTEEAFVAAGVVQESIQDKAKDAQIINTVASTADLKAQNTRINALEAAGGSEFLTDLMAELGETTQEFKAAQDEVQEIQNRPVEGVLDYFAQQFALILPETRLAETKRRVDATAAAIGTISQAQESVTRAVATTKKTVNVASIEAGNRAVAEQANIDAATSKLASLRDNAAALRAGMAADATVVSNKIKLVELHNSEVNQKVREEEHAFQVEAHKARLKQYEEGAVARRVALTTAEENLADIQDPKRKRLVGAQRDKLLKDIDDDLKNEAVFSTNVQIGQTVTGTPMETAPTIVKQGMQAPTAKERIKYDKLNQIGMRPDSAFGLSPGDALETISITGADPKLEPVKLLVTLNQDYQKTVAADAKRSLPKTQAAYTAEFDTHVKPILAGWRKEIKEGDTTNPFQAPPMSVLAERKAVQDSTLFKKILAPMAMKEFNGKKLYEAALTGVASKEITLEEAALGIETIFEAAVDHNNETKMFTRAGIPAQTSYISEIVEPAFFSSRTIGATAGAGLGTAAVAATGALATTPPGAAAAIVTVGLSTLVGSNIENLGPAGFALTDSTDRTEIMRTLTKLIANERSIFGGIF